MTERLLWGGMWRSENKLDGKTQHLLNRGGGVPLLFRTRKEVREFINQDYGYIREREDLREEPHGWKMPIPVRVKVIAMEGK